MEIFKLFGSILINSDDADKSLHKTDSKAKALATTLGGGIKTAAKWAAGIAAGAIAVGTAMLSAASKTAETADEIDKMSQKIGLSKEAYQEWAYAMSQCGVDISVMQNGVKTLTNLMDSAANGNAAAAETFETLGLSIYDSSGALKDQETMMREAIMTLANMEDSTERAKLATELFGKAGTELEPLLNSGSAGIEELMARAHELGLVMSDEAVDAGVVFGDTLADVKDSLSMVGTELGSALMPLVQSALDWVIAHLPEIKAVVNQVMDGVSAAISGIQAFISEHGAEINAIVSTVVDAVKVVIDTAMKVIENVIKTVSAAINGDWEAAWDGFLGIVTSIGEPLFNAGKAILTSLWEGLKNIWASISNWVSEKVAWLVDKLSFWKSGSAEIDGGGGGNSHASGLAYVPYDGYRATLHRGETVLNARDADEYRNGKDDPPTGSGGRPITIVVQTTLDGKVVSETVTTYQDNDRRSRG